MAGPGLGGGRAEEPCGGAAPHGSHSGRQATGVCHCGPGLHDGGLGVRLGLGLGLGLCIAYVA